MGVSGCGKYVHSMFMYFMHKFCETKVNELFLYHYNHQYITIPCLIEIILTDNGNFIYITRFITCKLNVVNTQNKDIKTMS